MDDADPFTKYPSRLVRRLLAAYHGFNVHDGSMMAASVAYYFALSLFPLLLVLVAGLGVALRTTAVGQDAQERLLAALDQQISPELSKQVSRALSNVSENAGSRGPIGFAVLLVTSVAIFTQVDHAFSRIWRLPEEADLGWRAWLSRLAFRRFKALLMLLGAGAFILAATISSLVWSAVQAAIQPAVHVAPQVNWGFGLTINVGLNFLAFATIYRFVPRARIEWSAALRGASVAAILWELGRQVLTIYLVRRGYVTAYGVIGSFLAIMLWTYYAMLVVFFGAEYTRAVNEELNARSGRRR